MGSRRAPLHEVLAEVLTEHCFEQRIMSRKPGQDRRAWLAIYIVGELMEAGYEGHVDMRTGVLKVGGLPIHLPDWVRAVFQPTTSNEGTA